jgi:MOSC domain-containing protein
MLIGTVNQIWRYPVKSMAGERLDECTVAQLGIPGDRGWALRDEQTGEITNGKKIPLLMQCAAHYCEQPANDNIPNVEIILPDGTSVRSDDERVNEKLSAALGRQVTLWPRQPANNREHYRRKSAAARIVGRMSRNSGFRSLLPTLTKLPQLSEPLREAFGREKSEPIPDISQLPPEILEFTSPLGTYFDAFPIHILTRASLHAMAQVNSGALWDARRFRPNFFVNTTDDVKGLVEASWNGQTLRIGSVELKCEIPTARCAMTTHAQAGIPKDSSVLRSIVKNADQNLGIYASVIQNGTVTIGHRVELVECA